MINILICDDDIDITNEVNILLKNIEAKNRNNFNIDIIKNRGDFIFSRNLPYDIAIC